jgi:hypothetical protein
MKTTELHRILLEERLTIGQIREIKAALARREI